MNQWIITDRHRTKLKLTTVALESDQFLLPDHHASIVETYCFGYKEQGNGRAKRDKTIDGYYFTKELSVKPPKLEDMDKDSTHFIK